MDTLIALLQETQVQSPNDKCYVLVDCAQQARYPQALFKAFPSLEWRSLFVNVNEEKHLSAAPLLFAIDTQQDWFKPLMARLTRDGFEQPLFTLLTSALSIDLLTTHLGQYTHTVLNTQDAVVVRYYDPRILQRFVHILDDSQRSHFLAPLKKWWYVDRDGHMRSIQGGASSELETMEPFTLTPAQADALAEVNLPDRVVNALREEFAERFAERTEYGLYQDANTLVGAASKYGLAAWGDIRLFCACGFSSVANFYESPTVTNVLDSVAKGEQTLETAIQSIPTKVWEEIAAGKSV